jgi:hypothetical protein
MRRVILWLIVLAGMCAGCGPSGPQQVELAVGSTADRIYPLHFVASGPAVDAGLVCDGGEVDEADSREEVDGEESVGETTFICDDGTGSFVLETVIDTTGFEGEGLPVSEWRVISGTGSYTNLEGQGAHSFILPSEVYELGPLIAVLQVVIGEVSTG